MQLRFDGDTDALYALGMLSVEEGDLTAAQTYVETALALKPRDAALNLLLANILKTKGLYAKAGEILLTLIKHHPDSATAFNNLGTVYFAQNKFADAIQAYQAAIHLQADYADAYYNLGLAFNKARRYEEAINTYQALIAMRQDHLAGQFQLGCLLMQQQKYQEAITHFLIIENKQSFHFETKTNLATCYLRLLKWDAAKEKYLQAIDLIPTDTQVLFNLGIISAKQGRLVDAITYYLQVVKLAPDFFEAHNNLGIAFLNLNDKKTALLHFRAALHIEPNSAAIRHTISILTHKEMVSFAPPEYVKALFDSYADHYESHLRESLHYQVPQLMYAAIQAAGLLTIVSQWDILDLGCGTGLCGDYFKPCARSLIGVDISAKMLEVAAQKNKYDELIEKDILIFLNSNERGYDLILAADVFVYFGDLDVVFSKVKHTLHSQGLFIFSTEISHDDDYVMRHSGRFAHSKRYLEKLILHHGFKTLREQTVILRTQNEMMVQGYLYLLQA